MQRACAVSVCVCRGDDVALKACLAPGPMFASKPVQSALPWGRLGCRNCEVKEESELWSPLGEDEGH